ncbi:hypothetical protein BT63DRAFT_459085 [Microthyrium microscopicum]|uniref:Uncharacterized protein n=1 Tax=Microthyrium microscopicum TaxID=703497 RepID=A0A6A6U3I9_9PEZI|nr:hypothetical protein BT63DRAFT_459085 [Microthyrium microscopicum]
MMPFIARPQPSFTLSYPPQVRQAWTDRGCDQIRRPLQVERCNPVEFPLSQLNSTAIKSSDVASHKEELPSIKKEQHNWETRVHGSQLVQDGRATNKFQLVVYPNRTGNFLEGVAIWANKPYSFDDLVQLIRLHHSYPLLHQLPSVMSFPEFSGYPWRHRWPIQPFPHFNITLDNVYDQILFQ